MSERKRTLVVYVAGRYRSKNGINGVHLNIQEAREIAIKLWQPGVAVICPHTNTAYFDGSAPDEVWLDGDLELVYRSDALVTVPGWEQSVGATEEVNFARSHNIPVFHTVEEFNEWREMWSAVVAQA